MSAFVHSLAVGSRGGAPGIGAPRSTCARSSYSRSPVVTMRVATTPPLPPPSSPLNSDEGKSEEPARIPALRKRADGSTTYVREMVGEGGLLATLASSVASDRLIVVKFYAPYCRSCKAVGNKLDKLSKEMYNKMGVTKRDVILYEVDITHEENVEFYRKHKVTHLPTFRFYRPSAGTIEDFTASPSKFGTVRIKLREHLSDRAVEGPAA